MAGNEEVPREETKYSLMGNVEPAPMSSQRPELVVRLQESSLPIVRAFVRAAVDEFLTNQTVDAEKLDADQLDADQLDAARTDLLVAITELVEMGIRTSNAQADEERMIVVMADQAELWVDVSVSDPVDGEVCRQLRQAAAPVEDQAGKVAPLGAAVVLSLFPDLAIVGSDDAGSVRLRFSIGSS